MVAVVAVIDTNVYLQTSFQADENPTSITGNTYPWYKSVSSISSNSSALVQVAVLRISTNTST